MPKIKYSFNPKITPSQTKQEAGAFSLGWEVAEVEWEHDALTELVRTRAYLTSSVKNGHKTASNVEEVYFIALDFDKGSPTMEEFIHDGQKFQFSWFLHTTMNHTPENNRFRVWIPLKNPISGAQLRNLKPVFYKKFPQVDSTCFQGERYYMISANAQTEIFTKLDPFGAQPIFLDATTYLDVPQPDPPAVRLSSNSSNSSNSSDSGGPGRPKKYKTEAEKQTAEAKHETFTLETPIRLKNNAVITAGEVRNKTEIFCPFCIHDSSHRTNPNNPNAFITFHKSGSLYIYCSSEDKTYWQEFQTPLSKYNTTIFYNKSTKFYSHYNEKYKYIENLKDRTDLQSWCANNYYDERLAPYSPRFSITFDPSKKPGINYEDFEINIFEESDILIKAKEEVQNLPDTSKNLPLDQVLDAIEANCDYTFTALSNIFGDRPVLGHFINWIAAILQTRKKSFTAWIISSKTQGVGKDLLFVKILRPIFGEAQIQLFPAERIGDKFNSSDETCWIRGYNEVWTDSDKKVSTFRRDWLKAKITDNYQQVERKGIDIYEVPNFMNFILFSNNAHALDIEVDDRRFNVVRNPLAKNLQKEVPGWQQRDIIEAHVANELPTFARLLLQLQIDTLKAEQVVHTQARHDLIQLSQTDDEDFFQALLDRNIHYFDFDSIFPVSEHAASLDSNYRSEKAELCEKYLLEYGVIKATFLKPIFASVFKGTFRYNKLIKRLKSQDLVELTVRLGEGKSPERVYTHKLNTLYTNSTAG